MRTASRPFSAFVKYLASDQVVEAFLRNCVLDLHQRGQLVFRADLEHIRTGAQALAPVLFGAVSQYVFGGGNNGLRWTFVVMMIPLTASAVFLFAAARRYPADVATAAAVAAPRQRGAAPRP
jgi:hypothetical protein